MTNNEIENHKKLFYEYLDNAQPIGKKNNSKIVTAEKLKIIKYFLWGKPLNQTVPDFKYEIKRSNYNLKTVVNLSRDENGKETTTEDVFIGPDGEPILMRNVKLSKKQDMLNLRVVAREDFFDIIYKCHSLDRGHAGYRKVSSILSIEYYGLFALHLFRN